MKQHSQPRKINALFSRDPCPLAWLLCVVAVQIGWMAAADWPHDERMLLLLPADVLHPRRPDEHFAEEANAAADAGWDVALIDHDALSRLDGDAGRAVAGVPKRDGAGVVALYRGWMLRSEQYEALADVLARRGVKVRTGAGQYRSAHQLPGWYPALAEVTPRSVWTVGDARDSFEDACCELGAGPAVLRDYVKSMKHYWHEAAYIPDVGDTAAAWRVAERFRQLRDVEFTGGFVLRTFEHFGPVETRTWWIDGVCRLASAHPDTPEESPPADLDLSGISPLIAALRLPFVTVDVTRRSDGAWRVVEIGDGQVSDRPVSTAPGEFFAAIAGAPVVASPAGGVTQSR